MLLFVVLLHPVQSTYTGVYARGGPTNTDMDPTNLGALCDRSNADVRGIKMRHPARRTTGHDSTPTSASSTQMNTSMSPTTRRATAEQIAAVRRSTTDYLAGKMANMGV
jgi:hypothetical protein